MITNLFSIFEPSSSFSIFNNWVSLFLIIFLVLRNYWVNSFKVNLLIKKIIIILYIEFKLLLGPIPGFLALLISLFIFILVGNFLGLFPYIFNSTRHISVSLSLAFPLWIRLIIFGWINHSIYIFAHLVPQRTPVALISFIVLIETIRNIIRPITLSVRLIANIVAGHLLITLLGNLAVNSIIYIVVPTLIFQLILLLLELSVSFIQAYVFSILITLYVREVSSH